MTKFIKTPLLKNPPTSILKSIELYIFNKNLNVVLNARASTDIAIRKIKNDDPWQ